MTPDPALTSPSRIERLLELACSYNSPLSIHAESGGKAHQFTSSMLDMKKAPTPHALIIGHPFTEETAAPIRPGDEIEVFFAIEQGRYAFDAKVVEKARHDPGDGRKIPAFEITYPASLKNGQRRAHYRVPSPLHIPIDVACTIIDNGKARKTIDSGGAEHPASDMRLGARTINISVGGMLLTFLKGDAELASVGDRLALMFSLEEDETPLEIDGIIRRIEKKASTEEVRAGVEFIDTGETFEYKLAINRLYKYVAEKQKENPAPETGRS
jgi:c-di-GMP-binding flagellar brake protein YcgR